MRYECLRYQGFTVNKNICCGSFIALLAIADIYIYVDIYVYVCCHFSICSVCCILVRSHNITLLFFGMHYCIVKPNCSNFRTIIETILGVQVLRIFAEFGMCKQTRLWPRKGSAEIVQTLSHI